MTTSEQTPVSYEGVPVKCASCGGCFHTLTRHFEPVPPMKGHYLRMLPRYRGNGWYAFPEREWVIGDNVQCPQCGSPYRMASIVRQVSQHVHALSQGPDQRLEVETPREAPAQADAAGTVDASPVSAEAALEEPADGDVLVDDSDSVGIYDGVLPVDDLPSRVMKMTMDGETQANIAETCQISIYMVRQIQNGRKV